MVDVTMLSLRDLCQSNPLAFYDLAMMCRDKDYQPFGNNGELLRTANLIASDDTIHDSIRNIVLSAAEGDGLEMHIVSPIAESHI